MIKKNFNLIILGPAGSGKGTQARLLIKEFNMKTIEMGELVREAAKQKNKQAKLVAWMHKVGMHFSDDFILNLFEQKIKKINKKYRFLVDGYPRTAGQAWDLQRILKKYYKNRPCLAIWINVSDKESLKRLFSRALCSKCGKIFSNRKIKKCSDCGGLVKVRGYDKDKKAIQKRLDWFHDHVVPAIEFYKQRKMLIQVNGEQSVEKVFKEALRKIEKKLE